MATKRRGSSVSRRVGCWVAAVLGAGVVPVASVPAQETFEEAKDLYEEYQRRGPLIMHTRGRDRLAQTRFPEALQLLADSYPRAERPEDQVQYMIVTLATKYCNEEQHVDILDKWRSRQRKSKDAWLWFKALGVHDVNRGPAELLEVARGKGDVFLRAAAIEAMAKNKDHELLELVPEILAALPRKDVERAIMIESMASAILAMKHRLGQSEFWDPAAAVIHLLDDKDTMERTKLVIARHLAELFDKDEVVVEARDRSSEADVDHGTVRTARRCRPDGARAPRRSR